MPSILRNLKILEVSSVDRGAGEGVRIVLMKRDDVKKADTVEDLTKAIDAHRADAAAIEARAKALGAEHLFPAKRAPVSDDIDLTSITVDTIDIAAIDLGKTGA